MTKETRAIQPQSQCWNSRPPPAERVLSIFCFPLSLPPAAPSPPPVRPRPLIAGFPTVTGEPKSPTALFLVPCKIWFARAETLCLKTELNSRLIRRLQPIPYHGWQASRGAQGPLEWILLSRQGYLPIQGCCFGREQNRGLGHARVASPEEQRGPWTRFNPVVITTQLAMWSGRYAYYLSIEPTSTPEQNAHVVSWFRDERNREERETRKKKKKTPKLLRNGPKPSQKSFHTLPMHVLPDPCMCAHRTWSPTSLAPTRGNTPCDVLNQNAVCIMASSVSQFPILLFRRSSFS